MKKIYFSTLFIFTFCFGAFGQCPPDTDITFTSQQEVNNFAANYPNCTSLTGLRIGVHNTPSDITDLRPVSQLIFVGSVVYVRNNPLLTSLEGLDNIFHIDGDLRIINNSNLNDITALSGLTYLRILEVTDNPQLTSLNGLHNLSDNMLRIAVTNNPLLTDFKTTLKK